MDALARIGMSSLDVEAKDASRMTTTNYFTARQGRSGELESAMEALLSTLKHREVVEIADDHSEER